MKEDFEITVPEIDLVELAQKAIGRKVEQE